MNPDRIDEDFSILAYISGCLIGIYERRQRSVKKIFPGIFLFQIRVFPAERLFVLPQKRFGARLLGSLEVRTFGMALWKWKSINCF